MNFFLIANNTTITSKTIEDLPIQKEDIIILYNWQFPLRWKKIKEHERKWLFLRKKVNGWWGQTAFKKYKNKYQKIILASQNGISKKTLNSFKKKYGLDNVVTFAKKRTDITSWVKFPKRVIPQTGLISYIYVKTRYDELCDKIYLIGFTNKYKKRWSGHSRKIEQAFFKKEKDKSEGKIIKINK